MLLHTIQFKRTDTSLNSLQIMIQVRLRSSQKGCNSRIVLSQTILSLIKFIYKDIIIFYEYY
jgi:hypothetical protein